MRSQRYMELLVGLFLLFALMALTVLAFKVSGLTNLFPVKSYQITAAFDDIGSLKVRAPVKIGGVQIGEVTSINLDRNSFKALVKMNIRSQYHDIPDDSTAGIFTAGLLGDNYVAITPMYNTSFLKEGSQIQITHSAMVLEKLIGQLIYKISNNGDNNSANVTTAINNGNGEVNAHQ